MNYNDQMLQIALTYAHAKFSDFLTHANESEKTYGNDMDAFKEFLEVGLEVAHQVLHD